MYWLNACPPDRDHGGKYPIFVDQVQADALLVRLCPARVISWLQQNGLSVNLPAGSDPVAVRHGYVLSVLDGVGLRETISQDLPEARMIFGQVHTLSHIALRQAALLCGLDKTSLSEYVIPRALCFAVYSNHHFGATIGALTGLFEQSLAEWLGQIRDSRRCIYDPVCYRRESSCHVCTHLPETSCRFFNLNLSRAFLFGGHDRELGEIRTGFLDMGGTHA